MKTAAERILKVAQDFARTPGINVNEATEMRSICPSEVDLHELSEEIYTVLGVQISEVETMQNWTNVQDMIAYLVPLLAE